MPKKPFTRGRKPKLFSLLAKNFRKPGTKIICKSKPFPDDKSRCFVRKVIKDPLFSQDLYPLNELLKAEMERLEVKTANKKADLLIEMLKESQELVFCLYKKFVAQIDWEGKLERYLSVEWCGPGARADGLKTLLECIFGYIGLKNLCITEEKIEESEFCLDSIQVMEVPRVMELDYSFGEMSGGVLGQQNYGELLRIDLIEPKLPKREKENNRQLHDPDGEIVSDLNEENEGTLTDYFSGREKKSKSFQEDFSI